MANRGTIAKLQDREASRVLKIKLGSAKGVIARGAGSTYAEKVEAFKAHQRLIHGFREGRFVNEGGVVLVGRAGIGLPSEGYDDPKFDVAVQLTPEERDAKAKRAKGAARKVAPKGNPMVASAAAKWSRRGGFASLR